MTGRTIRIFLIDGTPNDILTAEIINWTGKIIIAPRSQLAQLARRDEVKRTGVYILAGEDADKPNQECIYLGESDNVFKRLTDHNKKEDKDFWVKTAVIISKDENLTKAHVRYLESKLIQLAKQAGIVNLVNGTEPEIVGLPESDIADMNFFLSQVQILLPVLGFSFSLPVPTPESLNEEESESSIKDISPVFYMSMSREEISAKAQEINGEFVILKDSQARQDEADSCPTIAKNQREQLKINGKLINEDTYLRFTENVSFSSPSTAAAVISGSSRNGRETWKVEKTNQTYKDWQQEKIDRASEISEREYENLSN
ncbi:MAG: GIY-YIG nuclease family protein [Coleofasciculaceae cyanobacterium]